MLLLVFDSSFFLRGLSSSIPLLKFREKRFQFVTTEKKIQQVLVLFRAGGFTAAAAAGSSTANFWLRRSTKIWRNFHRAKLKQNKLEEITKMREGTQAVFRLLFILFQLASGLVFRRVLREKTLSPVIYLFGAKEFPRKQKRKIQLTNARAKGGQSSSSGTECKQRMPHVSDDDIVAAGGKVFFATGKLVGKLGRNALSGDARN